MADLKTKVMAKIGSCPLKEITLVFPETDFTQTIDNCKELVLTVGGSTGGGFGRHEKTLSAGDETAINFGGAGLDLSALTFNNNQGDAYSDSKIISQIFKNGMLISLDEYTFVGGLLKSTGVVSDWSEGDRISIIQL